MHILHTALYTFPKEENKENFFTNRKLLLLVIISFILMTLTCDSGRDILGRNLMLTGLKINSSSWWPVGPVSLNS